MIQMPETRGAPDLDEAVRALELVWAYFVIDGKVRDPQTLGQFTSRHAIEAALSPLHETKEQSLARYCRHALEWFTLKKGAKPSTRAAATRLRGTLRRYAKEYGSE